MNILLVTNTYLPHVGGVARSIDTFSRSYRQRGHRVMVVAPRFPDMPMREHDVFRVNAWQQFNASDFSVALPVYPGLSAALDTFKPDIVHAHHPFLLGMTALRTARYRDLPLVFTHHTRYEQYTHYVPGDSPALKRFAMALATRYANNCAQVFAPSESIAALIRQRGVTSPIAVVPTGVDIELFATGDGQAFRQRWGIPGDAFVVGHLGRLAPEKNLQFLAESIAELLVRLPSAQALIIGSGPSETLIRAVFAQHQVADRLHIVGVLQQKPLADALHAMDVFAFASRTETQGMVVTEAMAAGLPVVALDGAGVREVVADEKNGRLLQAADTKVFSAALHWVAGLSGRGRIALQQQARATAARFSLAHCADMALDHYAALREARHPADGNQRPEGEDIMAWIRGEWSVLKSLAEAGDAAMGSASIQDDKEP
ncbi:MAG: glycosyltransferase [Natronospirillum sp.]|uniref:glycosyltransferase n=1 Tax=Natronospirillum sp. TaxID=2812955 RepID=UPI0025F63DD0|nr:glycosyltransferase [Natronospirillum sp.]MCH8552754.1 glycosyltransferase [Natronospirillum sp.]